MKTKVRPPIMEAVGSILDSETICPEFDYDGGDGTYRGELYFFNDDVFAIVYAWKEIEITPSTWLQPEEVRTLRTEAMISKLEYHHEGDAEPYDLNPEEYKALADAILSRINLAL